MTREVVNQLKIWLDFKYRTRRICYRDGKTGKTVTEYKTPTENNPNALFFTIPKC
ncbi:MAG: hypothetical protein AB7F53_06650 [Nitrososphaeraceae archaeon]